MLGEFMGYRKPTASEHRLLAFLAEKVPELVADWVEDVLVRDHDDGGMGSLDLWLPSRSSLPRSLGKTVAEYRFKDEDGVDVLVALNLDQNCVPYELDIWKVDFSPLIRIPEEF